MLRWYRPGSFDEGIFHDIWERDEYELPQPVRGVVVDVGCHIGAFASLALERGAPRVLSFEALEENYHIAWLNLQKYGARSELAHAALWWHTAGVSIGRCPDPRNTGGHSVMGVGEQQVASVTLDGVLERLAEPVDVLKLDCEGAEFPVLYTCTTLGRVRRIAMETHDIAARPENCQGMIDSPPFTREALAGWLAGRGFLVRHWHVAENLGKLHAVRVTPQYNKNVP